MGQLFVLIMDGNPRRRTVLGRELKKKGVDAAYTSTIAGAKNSICNHSYELVVLRFTGRCQRAYQFCRWIRQTHPKLKILALWPHVSVAAEGRLFDCGVTDVAVGQQTKSGVLSKRIISRLEGCLPQERVLLGETLVNFDRQEAKRNNQSQKLTLRQVDLLRYFLAHPDRPITYAELESSDIWQRSVWSHAKGGRAIDMAICKLRKSIELDPKNPLIIQNLRSKGYRLGPGVMDQF